MGILHRVFGRRVAEVWAAEQRIMHRLGVVAPPVAVQWISTSRCDLTCPHCYSNAGGATRGELTTEQAVTRVLDELVRLDRPIFVIAGGESTLRKDFDAIVRETHRRKIPWAIHTHGGLVHRHAKTFDDCPPSMAAVSLDGPRGFHDAFRGRPGSYDKALSAMAFLKDCGVEEVVAGTTINRLNADLLDDMLPAVMGSRADSWGFHLMTPEGRAGENKDLLPTAAQLRRTASLARRLRSMMHVELDNEWGSAGRDDCFYRDEPFTCGAGRVSCVVSATGELMPCTTTDHGESAGNVLDTPLSELWASGFSKFRDGKDPLRGDLFDCWLNTRHGVSCRQAAFTADLFDDSLTTNGAARVPLTIGGAR
jgi:radical SAM protein with 4Fe4S-binding SPASM domain